MSECPHVSKRSMVSRSKRACVRRARPISLLPPLGDMVGKKEVVVEEDLEGEGRKSDDCIVKRVRLQALGWADGWARGEGGRSG